MDTVSRLGSQAQGKAVLRVQPSTGQATCLLHLKEEKELCCVYLKFKAGLVPQLSEEHTCVHTQLLARELGIAHGTREQRAGEEVSEQKEQTSTEKNLTAETSHRL